MDIQQLKLLAARLRGLLQRSECSIGHQLSLDTTASLLGLRNWPEVLAFPQRVVAAQIDAAALSRLAHRLRAKFDLDFTHEQLLEALSPEAKDQSQLPHVWPSGPAPGVYLTTDQAAINALLEKYEEATDGEIIYAERAGGGWHGSVDLGEYGLWSLARVPSGTLVIVGPVDLDQNSWSESADRLQMACINAHVNGHRVAVLINTPSPDWLCEDVLSMVRSCKDFEDEDQALTGVVTSTGDLVAKTPFARQGPSPAYSKKAIHQPRTGAIPSAVLAHLEPALRSCRDGIVLIGSGVIAEHSTIDLVEHTLALTEHVGQQRGSCLAVEARLRSTGRFQKPSKTCPFSPRSKAPTRKDFDE